MGKYFLIIFLFFASCANRYLERHPAAKIYIVSVAPLNDGKVIIFDLVNNGTEAFIYRGYSESDVISAIEHFTWHGWSSHKFICYTDFLTFSLPYSSKRRFRYETKEHGIVRFGLTDTNTGKTALSKSFKI